MKTKYAVPVVVLLLALLALAAYWQIRRCGFVNYDDNLYITSNPHMAGGLSVENIKWAFTTFDTGNWHPLTWISYFTDVEIRGLNPAQFHLTNLLLHLANVLLVFAMLRRLTKSTWRSAFVAALFAVHPLHVESVAWISERKDVLSTLFWIVTIWAYVRYTEKPGVARYAPVLVLFALGLMSKPMLVTLPVGLLLLDYRPLERVKEKGDRWKKVCEKIPLFMLSAASCAITWHAQSQGQAVANIEVLPLAVRISNATVAYTLYLWKMIWPTKLAVLYPLPGQTLPVWLIVISSVLFACMTALALWFGRKRPYLAVGWLWYVITLIPVIGLVQVGEQAMADRYTYVPLIGIFIVIAWGVPDILRSTCTRAHTAVCRHTGQASLCAVRSLSPAGEGTTGAKIQALHLPCSTFNLENAEHRRKCAFTLPLAVISVAVIGVLTGMAYRQVGYWQDGVTLFAHSIQSTRGYHSTHMNLGIALAEQGRVAEGTEELRKAAALRPDMPGVHYNLARALLVQNKYGEAIAEYQTAIALSPDDAASHDGLAVALFLDGDYAGAWSEIHVFESLGGTPHPGLIHDLSERMPDPGQ